jgi:hypothetical protein
MGDWSRPLPLAPRPELGSQKKECNRSPRGGKEPHPEKRTFFPNCRCFKGLRKLVSAPPLRPHTTPATNHPEKLPKWQSVEPWPCATAGAPRARNSPRQHGEPLRKNYRVRIPVLPTIEPFCTPRTTQAHRTVHRTKGRARIGTSPGASLPVVCHTFATFRDHVFDRGPGGRRRHGTPLLATSTRTVADLIAAL